MVYVVHYPNSNECEYFGDACLAYFFAKDVKGTIEVING